MSYASREAERQWLHREIETQVYLSQLRKLQAKDHFFEKFGSWDDVIRLMRSGTSDDPIKDRVLRPIFVAHANDRDPRWRTILMVIFWPALCSIHRQKRAWDQDEEERWAYVTWAFLEILCRIDPRKRPHRLVQKVFNDTVNRLYQEYTRTWRRTRREVPELHEEDTAVGDRGLFEVEKRLVVEAEVQRLKSYANRGIISQADMFILIATRIYGKTMAAYASDAGLNYENARKRRQRAEASIQRWEKKNRQ